MDTLDIQFRKNGIIRPLCFRKILVKHFGEPTVLTIGKAPTLQCTLTKLKTRILSKYNSLYN